MKTLWAVTGALVVSTVLVGAPAAKDLKAFDASGKLLGTGTTTTETEKLAFGQRADIDLGFPTVTGPAIAKASAAS